MKKLIFLLLFIPAGLFAQTDSLCAVIRTANIDTADQAQAFLYYQSINKSLKATCNDDQRRFDANQRKLRAGCTDYGKLYDRFSKATPIKPMSDGEYYENLIRNSKNKKLTPWTLDQIKTEIKTCTRNIKDKKACSCAVENISKTLNFKEFTDLTEYQKGKVIYVFYQGKCE